MQTKFSTVVRKKTRPVKLGTVEVGGVSPITVQSMTNTKTKDVQSTVKQIKSLEEAGCEIIRVAVPDMESAMAISEIKKCIRIPLVADIQFDYKLAIRAVEHGADGLRINPGNIGDIKKIKEVVKTAKDFGAPIRIGVNSGSLESDLLSKYGGPTPQALVESAQRHIDILEGMSFYDIVVSIKSSDVYSTVKAYELISKETEYPLHLGITEAGTFFAGSIKSSVGLGILLYEGIGDTIRVSLTGDPLEEVRVGYEILKSLGLRKRGINLISCPTCARTEIDLVKIATEVEEKLKDIKPPLNIAVMRCVVNGPGEAKEADIGLAGGKNKAVIFKNGNIIKTVKEQDAVSELLDEVKKICDEQ
ncbi:MAG: flavodoxin-dependent (E)-4-hydroxy-3-methylbut-2-enyl-diphosphate synthase [Thermoanaerobacterales bacterium]|nr:flavodoxin-dependent (E)-4-hydroxy-3-methylbut-2-enyl-diphosphate synthase [Thermoanaerobacterales bacterium]